MGFCGEPSGRGGEFTTRVEVLDFRLDSVEGAEGRNAVDDTIPDLIIPRPVVKGMVTLIASSMAGWSVLKTERAGVLSLEISLML